MDQMKSNLDSTRGLIVAEAVMMELANTVGRQRAHEIVYDACKRTIESREPSCTLFDTLIEKSEVTSTISEGKVKQLCTPANYMGSAGAMVDAVLALNEKLGG